MWRRSLALTVALATSLAAGGAAAEEADMARMHRRAEALAQRYLVGWSSGNAQALADVQALYGPRVNFYGKFIDQRSLFAQKRSFGQRWPIRRYAHRPGTMQVTCDAATRAWMSARVTGTRSMDLSDAAVTHSQLVKAGVPGDLIVGEGMDHCYINWANLPESQDAYQAIVKFFRDHLG